MSCEDERNSLKQGLANYVSTNDSPLAKSGPLPVFINKALLGHSHTHHLHIAKGGFGLQKQS